MADIIPAPGKNPITENRPINTAWLAWFDKHVRKIFNDLIYGLAASRLVATDANKNLEDVANLASWVAGTAGQIAVANDGDGTITLSGDGSDTDFTVLTVLEAGGGGAIGIRYKTRALTLNKGIVTTVGAESDYTNL